MGTGEGRTEMAEITSGEWQVEPEGNRGRGTISVGAPHSFFEGSFREIATARFDGGLYQRKHEEIVANMHMIAAAPKMLNALKVVALAPKTRDWLATNDPKALEQIEDAIAKAEKGEM